MVPLKTSKCWVMTTHFARVVETLGEDMPYPRPFHFASLQGKGRSAILQLHDLLIQAGCDAGPQPCQAGRIGKGPLRCQAFFVCTAFWFLDFASDVVYLFSLFGFWNSSLLEILVFFSPGGLKQMEAANWWFWSFNPWLL